jgi:hypothetical protein
MKRAIGLAALCLLAVGCGSVDVGESNDNLGLTNRDKPSGDGGSGEQCAPDAGASPGELCGPCLEVADAGGEPCHEGVCVGGICQLPPDGGFPDAGSGPDGGTADAGSADGGETCDGSAPAGEVCGPCLDSGDAGGEPCHEGLCVGGVCRLPPDGGFPDAGAEPDAGADGGQSCDGSAPAGDLCGHCLGHGDAGGETCHEGICVDDVCRLPPDGGEPDGGE